MSFLLSWERVQSVISIHSYSSGILLDAAGTPSLWNPAIDVPVIPGPHVSICCCCPSFFSSTSSRHPHDQGSSFHRFQSPIICLLSIGIHRSGMLLSEAKTSHTYKTQAYVLHGWFGSVPDSGPTYRGRGCDTRLRRSRIRVPT